MIDTSAWKEFKLSELFDVKNSKSISDKRGLDFDEKNPYDFIGRTPVNNGIQGKIVKQDFEPNNENTFSVTQIGEKLCLFRDNKWYACQNIFLLTPLYPELITAKFFICCVVTNTLKAVFGEDAYSSYPTKDTLSDMVVKLPATSDGQPNWDYMESYMKAVMEESEKSLENLRKADDAKHLIDVSRWHKCRLGDYFDFETGKDMLPTKEKDGDIPVVCLGSNNNGIGLYIAENPKHKLYDEGCITIAGWAGGLFAFYQEQKFYVKGRVKIAIPKQPLSKLAGLFMCTMIDSESWKYTYAEKASGDKLPNTELYLPITSTGEPNWQYMEDYMRRIMDKSEQIISDLQIGA